MANYPGTEKERRIQRSDLESVVAGIFAACGMSKEDAAILGGSLVQSDLRGIHSHGTLRVPEYASKLTGKGVDPAGRPTVVKDGGAILVVDGGNSMGVIGATFAMNLAIERAAKNGLAAVAVRGSNHCGAMDTFTRMAAARDMIGIATTNALPTMAPWGGAERVLGINPLSIAVPTGTQHPIVLDAAFSASSHGKVRVYAQKGAKLPEGWAFDKDGQPTIDPVAAIDGLLQPIGQYKGTGLALMMGILSSLLSGAAYGNELGDMHGGPIAGKDGHFILALNIAAFTEVATFKQRADKIVKEYESCRRAPGFDSIHVPGGLEAAIETRYLKEGIPLNDATVADIVAIARARDVAVPASMALV